MSKPSRRPNREAIKRARKEKKKAEKQLLQNQQTRGLVAAVRDCITTS